MRLWVTGLVAASIFVNARPSFGQSDDGCRDVLTYAARNYSAETLDSAILVRTYSQYCEGTEIRSGTSFSAGLSAVVEAIPIKFNLGTGSTEQRLKHFCKTFHSEYKAHENFYQEVSTVAEGSVKAWSACKNLAGQGVLFRPKMGRTQVIIEVARTSASPASVQGVTYDSKLMSCSVPSTDKKNDRSPADQSTTKALSDAYWPITCVRHPQRQSGTVFYPGVEISVGTTKGAFLLPVSEDALFERQWASDFSAELSKMKTEIASKLVQATLECATSTAESEVEPYSEAVARIPNTLQASHFVVGGGCLTGKGPKHPHNAFLLESRRTDDGLGWRCKSGDQANISTPVKTYASVTYCSVKSAARPQQAPRM
jgi:hypothetical protein